MVQSTTASRIASAAFDAGLTWKQQLLLFVLICISSFVALIVMPIIALFGAVTVLIALLALATLTANAIINYSDTPVAYIVTLAICFGGTWLFAKAHREKPRKFFDYLARGGFWYFAIITTFMVFAGFGWIVNHHGWGMAIGAVVGTVTILKLLEVATTK